MSRISILLPIGIIVGLIFFIPTIPDYDPLLVSGITIFVVALFITIMNLILNKL